MFVSPPVLKSLALLVFLVPFSSVVAKQEEESDNSSLLMTNFNALREEGQGFYLAEGSILYEKPDSVTVSPVMLSWWCDFEFSSDGNDIDTTKYGYIGKAVEYLLGSSLEEAVAQGAEISQKIQPLSVSAVMVPTLGIFEGQIHATQDDWIFRFWDDGSATLPILGSEGHDEGDTRPNADTSAWSGSGTYTKITTEKAAKYLGMNVSDMTPATCSAEYEASWNATNVPNPFDTKVTPLEEELLLRVVTIEESLIAAEDDVAQLQADNKELKADNKELLLRVASIEESLAAAGAKNTGSGKSTKKQKKQIQK